MPPCAQKWVRLRAVLCAKCKGRFRAPTFAALFFVHDPDEACADYCCHLCGTDGRMVVFCRRCRTRRQRAGDARDAAPLLRQLAEVAADDDDGGGGHHLREVDGDDEHEGEGA